MSESSPATTENDAPPPVPEPMQFSLGELLLWMAGASVGWAAVYWLEWFGASLAILAFVGFVPYRLGLCSLGDSTAIVLVLAYFVAALVPMPWADNFHRETARNSACRNNLQQISLALINYHDIHGTFPPAYIADASGKPMHSWRVLILPFIDQQSLYKRYRFDEPWDGPNNRQLHSAIVKTFACPSSGNLARGTTSYLAVTGPATAWPGQTGVSLDDVRDLQDETLLLVEVHNSGIHWMEPRDLPFDRLVSANPSGPGPLPSSKHTRDQPVNAAFVSGRVQSLPEKLPPDQWRAMLTIDGGETVNLP